VFGFAPLVVGTGDVGPVLAAPLDGGDRGGVDGGGDGDGGAGVAQGAGDADPVEVDAGRAERDAPAGGVGGLADEGVRGVAVAAGGDGADVEPVGVLVAGQAAGDEVCARRPPPPASAAHCAAHHRASDTSANPRTEPTKPC
jgi:hypothetical protein